LNSSTQQLNKQTITEHQTAFIIDLSIENQQSKKSFDHVFLETLDSVLSCLGESCKHAIYAQLERQYAMSREDIPSNVKAFAAALEKLLGSGAGILEIKILSILHSKVGQFSFFTDDADLSFVAYLQGLRSYLAA
jgi:hypothetical protein